MDRLADARCLAFSRWLRTGRLPGWRWGASAEFKFNPWHDPDDGRFTFRGAGKYFPPGNGGGRADDAVRMARRPLEHPGSGGGGASETYEAPEPESGSQQGGPNWPRSPGEAYSAIAAAGGVGPSTGGPHLLAQPRWRYATATSLTRLAMQEALGEFSGEILPNDGRDARNLERVDRIDANGIMADITSPACSMGLAKHSTTLRKMPASTVANIANSRGSGTGSYKAVRKSLS